jgi:cobalamin-dependent methionine synthase I
MRQLQQMGEGRFDQPSEALNQLEQLLGSQAEQGAAYLDVNLDALSDPDALGLMRGFVRLVHRCGKGVPPCVDSSDARVLEAGLGQWFELGEGLRPPLLNSIPFVDREKLSYLLDLRSSHDFSLVCLLVGKQGPMGSADEMVAAAETMFDLATGAGFRPDQLFFDTATLGICTDGCIDPAGNLKPSHTHSCFNAIRLIRQSPKMSAVRILLGVSNWGYGVRRRRVGHIRAFVAAAQTRGLDAAIADVSLGLGKKPAAAELVELVELFASLDGSEDCMDRYAAAIGQARENELF